MSQILDYIIFILFNSEILEQTLLYLSCGLEAESWSLGIIPQAESTWFYDKWSLTGPVPAWWSSVAGQ